MKNEIILNQSGELAEHIEVRLVENTVWFNRNQLVTLFGRDIKTIGKHINNVFQEGELEKSATVANFATVRLKLSTAVSVKVPNWRLGIHISMHPVTPLNYPLWC